MLRDFINLHFKTSFVFLLLAIFFGLLYSFQLLSHFGDLFVPENARSLHISLMLYGFAPLMLSMIPFALFEKDGLESKEGVRYLNIYFILWYIFLIFMIFSLAFGDRRNLPFYDFPYELNFILASAGIFYIIAVLKFIKLYDKKPLWVKVSLFVAVTSPVVLLVLMNPKYGQVTKSLQGPHGDNTLGMSFFLLVLYYLCIKIYTKEKMKNRYNIFWIIPLVFYIGSVLYRSFIGSLTYNEEWFLQWLTFLYIPMLYIWIKDAKISPKENIFLYISVIAFIFSDIEGNILFIPHIRSLFHRNDLVVGHAHIAVGLGFLFLAFGVVKRYISIKNSYIIFWAFLLSLIGLVLSLSGFYQANILDIDTRTLWGYRSLFGMVLFLHILYAYSKFFRFGNRDMIRLYHFVGFLSDGIGGIVLIFFGKYLYESLHLNFHMGYQIVVFGFMSGVGFMHLLGFIYQRYQIPMADATTMSRILVSSLFFALTKAGFFGIIGYMISVYDLFYALIYIIMRNALYKSA
jgi:hypothetical protein